VAKTGQLSALAYAVRPTVVIRYLSEIGLLFAALLLVPLAVAVAAGELRFAFRLGVLVVLLALVCGWLSRRPAPARMQINDALVVTALTFVLTPLLLVVPMMAAGLSPLDALFEAVSGITTTGLTTLPSVAELPAGFLFLRAWLQWVGGLGFVVLSVALLAGHQIAARRLLDPEAAPDAVVNNTRVHARRMLNIYLLLTLCGGLLLWPVMPDRFTAVTHLLAAISTGGFSSLDGSLAAMDLPAARTLTGISLFGAVSLPLYYLLYLRGWRALRQDPELALLAGMLLLITTLLVLLLRFEGYGWGAALEVGWLLGISAQTTTGFTPAEMGMLGAGVQAVLLLAMATGGCVGSTAGGIKLLRLLILWRFIGLTVQRTAVPPHAVVAPWLGGHRLGPEDIERALGLVILFVVTALLAWLPFLFYGYAPLPALFEVVSALGTVGLSSGITGEGLPPLLKGILCFAMLAGRLEFLALLVLLYPRSWLGKRREGL